MHPAPSSPLPEAASAMGRRQAMLGHVSGFQTPLWQSIPAELEGFTEPDHSSFNTFFSLLF